jgi:hypothetical protein
MSCGVAWSMMECRVAAADRGGGMTDESVERLNAVGVLTRREIEARIVAPLVDALGARFGRTEVVAIVREVIATIAREQGRVMAESCGDASLDSFAQTLGPWTKDDALRLHVIHETPAQFDFDVTGCRYAELYRALGIPELGEVLSCQRDAALVEGFNPELTLTRTQTIMQGAACCDFRYRAKARE